MIILQDKIPKIFISYSWSDISENFTMELANRLRTHGVDVLLDKWDLKSGQDKYVFMEQCVTDTNVDKVLIICDKTYTEKADARSGGVGNETIIISPEIYKTTGQTKFIPVIVEKDEDGSPYLPAYIATRIYIDLSDETTYEDGYERLLRDIYEKPLHEKPALGKMPEWLNKSETNYFPIESIIKQVKKPSNNMHKNNRLILEFSDAYIKHLENLRIEGKATPQGVYDKIVELKIIRDIYLDFLDSLLNTEIDLADVITSLTEKVYNSLIGDYIRNGEDEPYHFYIWETFICSVAFLKYHEKYKELHDVLSNTYFLKIHDSKLVESSYTEFCRYSTCLEEQYKPTTGEPNLHTLAGKMLCDREKKPIYTKDSLPEADVLLYQLSECTNRVQDSSYHKNNWFPMSYIYFKNTSNQWRRLKSRKYCEKIMPLFNANSIEDLKEVIKDCQENREIMYRGSWDCAPHILSNIDIEDVGSIN